MSDAPASSGEDPDIPTTVSGSHRGVHWRWRGMLLALAGGGTLTALWFAWLFEGPAPPPALLAHYPTTVTIAFGLGALLLLVSRARIPDAVTSQSALFALALLLFGIPLAGMWSGGPAGENVLLGLFPYSDAEAYENGAFLLMEDGKLDGWNSRRPLTAVFLGSLFTASHGNLQVTQAMLVYFNATASFCAARALWLSHGLAAGLLALVTLYVFYARQLGSLLSENLGLALGAAAFALLWQGARDGKKWLVALGLFALSLGLNARAGAFFVLPALILWLTWRRTEHGTKQALWTFAWTTIAAAAGFVPNIVVGAIYGSEQGLPFGNFAPTLYGLAVGGKGWTQAYQDHPYLETLPEAQAFREMYGLAFSRMLEKPQQLLAGVGNYYFDYLFNTRWHKFFDNRLVRAAAILLTLTGIVHCVRQRRRVGEGMLLVMTVGVLASVPFLFDGAPRAYAVTISATAALIGVGAMATSAWIGKSSLQNSGSSGSPHLAVALVLTLTVLCGPMAWLYAGQSKSERSAELEDNCADGRTLAVADVRPGSFVVVMPGNRSGHARLPMVSEERFMQDFDSKFPVDMSVPAYVARVRDQVSGKLAWVVAEGVATPLSIDRLRLCGEWRHQQVFVGAIRQQ